MLFKVKNGKRLSKVVNGLRCYFTEGMEIELSEKEAKDNADHVEVVRVEIPKTETIEVKEKTEIKFNKRNKK